MRILIFGDSITQGFWDTEGGWVERLIREYNAETLKDLDGDWFEIFNLGISGDTTDGLINRIEAETKARVLKGEEPILVIALGINDSRSHGSENVSTPKKYGQNLEILLQKARTFTDKVLFVGCTACEDKLTDPVAWGDTHYTNDRIWEFERTLRSFCAASNVPLVTLLEEFQEVQKRKNLLTDGLHPNDAGHEMIAKMVKPELQRLIAS